MNDYDRLVKDFGKKVFLTTEFAGLDFLIP